MKKSCLTKGQKVLSVILGAVIGGFMWRCRGEGGFGSSWGLYSVGLVLMLFIFHFYSGKKGMRYEMIPLGGLMLGLSVNGYATVICQLAGFVESDLNYSGKLMDGVEPVMTIETYKGLNVLAPVSTVSGAIIIFLMAFTFIPLFSFFVLSLFSGKKYRIRDYIIVIAVFFISQTIFKATVSHFILSAINPQQVQYAALGLKEMGFEFSSPMKAYMTHFLDRGWADDIPFFENYYMSIDHVSDCLAILSVSLYALIAKKDKYTGFGSLVLNALVALASTSLSILSTGGLSTGIHEGVDLPDWFIKISDWGVWEYLTGFFVGLFVMLFLAVTADKHTENCGADETPLFENKTLSFGFNFVLTVFIFGVAPARAIALRLAGLLENLEILPDKEPLATILIVVLSIVFGLFMIKIMKKNILDNGLNAFGMAPKRFAQIALPSYLAMCFVVYFFLDDFVITRIKTAITVPLMLITSAVIFAVYSLFRLNEKKKEN